MGDKSFYCEVVGMSITADVCETRVRQAKEFSAKGEPHASLNKCIICKELEPIMPPDAPKVDGEVCSHCKRPRIYKKLRWTKKHGMHVNCYTVVSKKGKVEVPKAAKPALDIKTTTAEPLEDPERIIQCSASPSWARCHGCYAVKNCAIYDEAMARDKPVVKVKEDDRIISCSDYEKTKDPLICGGCESLDNCAVTPGVTVVRHPAGTITESPAAAPDTSEQDHYTACAIQPIEFIVANNMDFLEGNIVKYVARYKRKNGLEDLAKARHYLDMLIKREEASLS